MRTFYSDHFALPLPADHRFPMEKYALLRNRVESTHPAVAELIEPEATEQLSISDDEVNDDDLDHFLRAVGDNVPAAIFNDAEARRVRSHTSITNLSRLRGLELTSMINLSALGDPGAKPLVDLDEFIPPRARAAEHSVVMGTVIARPRRDAKHPVNDLSTHGATAVAGLVKWSDRAV